MISPHHVWSVIGDIVRSKEVVMGRLSILTSLVVVLIGIMLSS